MTLVRPTAKLCNLCCYSIKGEPSCRHSIGFHDLTLTWVKWCKVAIVSRTNLFKGNARVLKKWHKILKQIACFLYRLDLKVPINMKFNIALGPIYNIPAYESVLRVNTLGPLSGNIYVTVHIFFSFPKCILPHIWCFCPLRLYRVRVSKFQNEYIKSSFLPKVWTKNCQDEGGNPSFIFWEKWWPHKLILKFTDLYYAAVGIILEGTYYCITYINNSMRIR